jgi:uncharacterized protein (TIGR02391 family)
MQTKCYFCKEKAKLFNKIFDGENVECSRCGRYKISRTLVATHSNIQLDPKEVSKISGWIRENQEELITTDKLQEMLKIQSPTDDIKAFKILKYFSENYNKGKIINLTDYKKPPYILLSVAWSEELSEVLNYLIGDILINKKGFLKYFTDKNTSAVTITSKGWDYISSDDSKDIKVKEQMNMVDDKEISLDRLHPKIVNKCKKLFEDGHYRQAVTESMLCVEVAVREKAGLPDTELGKKLMNKCFGIKNPLLKLSENNSEQESAQFLYSGSIGYFKNPSSHRFVEHKDPMTTFEHLALASLLLRLLDDI